MSYDDQKQGGWKWKAEPASPIDTSSLDIDDEWLSFESKENLSNDAVEQDMYEERTSRAQVATKLLEELDEWIKEEPYGDWLEQKIDLPIFEELSAPSEYGVASPVTTVVGKFQQHETTRTLLQEFESVLGDVEACHQVAPATALTPPQSPPAKFYEPQNAQILITLHPAFHVLGVPLDKPHAPSFEQISTSDGDQEPVLQWGAENVSLEPLGDVASELAAVDEIVRSCVEDISDISPSSPPSTSSDASYVSSEDSTDDPEWTPIAACTGDVAAPAANKAKNRYRKPYSRPANDDRKVRKKEQNKNAATRYRQKKKQEVKEIVGEEQELANHNEKLQGQVGDLQREIRYLKGLMRDLFKAQGLLK